MPFKEDCQHYEKIPKKSCSSNTPSNEYNYWCGDKGEWIESCDEPCKRYDFLNKEKIDSLRPTFY